MPPKKDYTSYGSRKEYVRQYMKRYNPLYRATHAKEIRDNRRIRKHAAVQYLGGRCARCGYDRCIAALYFHHKNPADKEHQIATMFAWSMRRIIKELDKCELLCACCHAEEHWKEEA